jgi:uncharacterized metal-binding protein
MPELPQKKVGIIACSGEEMAEGTVTRLAALKVLEQLRPDDTVTICLPLFLAGGEGDRAFARFYPTIAVDGCALRCAARATEQYSGKPAASVVVTDIVREAGLPQPGGRRRLDDAGRAAVVATAEIVAERVDELLEKKWSRRRGEFIENEAVPQAETDKTATCACGSGIPVQAVVIDGRPVTLVALPPLMAQFRDAGKMPSAATTQELLDQVALYNPVPARQEPAYLAALAAEYAAFCDQLETA